MLPPHDVDSSAKVVCGYGHVSHLWLLRETVNVPTGHGAHCLLSLSRYCPAAHPAQETKQETRIRFALTALKDKVLSSLSATLNNVIANLKVLCATIQCYHPWQILLWYLSISHENTSNIFVRWSHWIVSHKTFSIWNVSITTLFMYVVNEFL